MSAARKSRAGSADHTGRGSTSPKAKATDAKAGKTSKQSTKSQKSEKPGKAKSAGKAAGDPWVYLNGRFVRESEATTPITDRGLLFADGVYEVTRYHFGRAFRMDAHVERLKRSLAGIELAMPSDAESLRSISDELVERNGTGDGAVYWQITRGPAARQHHFPDEVHPTVMAMSWSMPAASADAEDAGPTPEKKVVLVADTRWRRVGLKTTMLLDNAMARQHAREAGADEAVYHRASVVTEGAATSVLAVCGGRVLTHPDNGLILPGVTRKVVLELAGSLGVEVIEEPVSLWMLHRADELMLTGTTTGVAAIVSVDGRPVGDGRPGEITTRFHRALHALVVRECGRG